MTHSHPLHTDLVVACLCCRAPRAFRFVSASDQVVCSLCARHQGSDKIERRNAEHVELWESLFTEQVEVHRRDTVAARDARSADAERISALESSVAQLTALAAGRFDAERGGNERGGDVRAAVVTEVTTRLERRIDLAARRTDRVMAVLWGIAARHQDGSRAGYCSCGAKSTECGETRLLEPERTAIAEWERHNVELARAGRRHALPAGHPVS